MDIPIFSIDPMHFTDDKIERIDAGRDKLTEIERAFLIQEGARLEECTTPKAKLEQMSDRDLMNTIYWAWCDYCR